MPLKATKEVEDDYRPPVPPHRNIGVTASGGESALTPKKHHHHHHHRNSKNHDKVHARTASSGQDDVLQQPTMRNVFEFDDEPHENEIKKDSEEKVNFVQYPKSPNSNCTE